MEMWELVAREQIRDTLHRYSWNGDRGRPAELAAQFTEDGVLGNREGARAEGRAAITAFLEERMMGRADESVPLAERPLVRHHISNILFLEVTPDRARVASYFMRLHRDWPEHWGVYRDVVVPAEERWLIAERLVSVDGEIRGHQLTRL